MFSLGFFPRLLRYQVGGLPLAELNALELQFLLLNGFDLVITPEELQNYANYLLLGSLPPLPSINHLSLISGAQRHAESDDDVDRENMRSHHAHVEDQSGGQRMAPRSPEATATPAASAPPRSSFDTTVHTATPQVPTARPKSAFRSASESSSASASEGESSTVVPSEDDSIDTERGGYAGHADEAGAGDEEEMNGYEEEMDARHRRDFGGRGADSSQIAVNGHPSVEPRSSSDPEIARMEIQEDSGSRESLASRQSRLPHPSEVSAAQSVVDTLEAGRRHKSSRSKPGKRENSRTRQWTMSQRQHQEEDDGRRERAGEEAEEDVGEEEEGQQRSAEPTQGRQSDGDTEMDE